MRILTWMLMTACLFGCGSGGVKSTKAKMTSQANELVVPQEVAAFFERGQLAQAVEKLTEMIARNPRDSDLYGFRAAAYQKQGCNDEALADFDQAISIDQRDAKLFNNRGFIYLGMQNFDAARADFDQATVIDPKYMNAFNNRGLLYIAQQNYVDAIKQFNIAIQIDSGYVDAYNNRGFAEYGLGQIEQALDDFNQAIRMNSNYVNAYNNRGLLRARAGDLENAVVDFTHAMMLDPINTKYYEHRRDVYRSLGAHDKARADERKIEWLLVYHKLTTEISKSEQPVAELIQRARHFLRANDDESAMRDLDQALSFNSRSPEALTARASLYLKQHAFVEAQADAQASVEIEPTPQAYSILGDLYLKQRNYDRAIENYSLARRVDQDVAKAYYARAKQLERQGQAEQARDNLQQALVLDPDIETRVR